MKRIMLLFMLMTSFMFMRLVNGQDSVAVHSVDLEQYVGFWYEIASFPAGFQKGCRCSTAEYQMVPGKRYIRVVNRCLKLSDRGSRMSVSRGKAFPVKGSGNTRLKVQFIWPFKGDYHIIILAGDYRYAVVGHPSRNYLWILSREPYMTSDTYSMLVQAIKARGYNVSLLQKTEQNCEDKQ